MAGLENGSQEGHRALTRLALDRRRQVKQALYGLLVLQNQGHKRQRMEPYYERNGIKIYHGDAMDILPTIGGADLVVADPPYTFGIASTEQSTTRNGLWGDLMNSGYWYAGWLKEAWRLTINRQGAIWVFNSWRSYPVLARGAYAAEIPISSLAVWDKEWIGPAGKNSLRPTYELIALMAHKKFVIENRSLSDIIKCKWMAAHIGETKHPAEKPLSLIRKLIDESGGGLVVDPFMGSGTTLKAAQELGQPAIGIEIEERYCEIAARRLAQSSLLTVSAGSYN